MMPPIEVPWPPMYLVVECMTIAAPCSIGWQSTGAGGVVHDQRHAELAADLGDFGDGKHGELRVGQRLAVVAARPRVGRAAEILGVGRVDEAALDAHGRSSCWRTDSRCRHRCRSSRRNCRRHGRCSGPRTATPPVPSQRQRGDAAFERGDALLEHGLRRIHDPRVDVAELLKREQVARMLGRLELIGRRLVDRHRDGRWSWDPNDNPRAARSSPDACSSSACRYLPTICLVYRELAPRC